VIDLTTPYTITGTKDVVIGYEFTGGGVGAFYSIGIDDSPEPAEEGNYYSAKTGSSYGSWGKLSSNGYYNLAIKVTIEGETFPLYDLAVSAIYNPPYLFPDQPFAIITDVKNFATETITNFKVKYEVGSSVSEKVISGVSIAPFKNYEISQDWSIAENGTYPVKVTVSEPNGHADEDASNNSGTGTDVVISPTVATTPRNRNVLLEEYTGIHCTWCPDGHKIANQLKAKNPGRFEVINIHEGSYATPSAGEPDFRTSFGTSLRTQTGLTGYPQGSISRHVFNGTATILDRGNWAPATAVLIAQPSPVNLLAKSTVDWTTRTLTVTVDGYYTANSTTTNALNVALLQEHVLGPQVGAANLYPAMLVGELYTHNHILRHLLTGQWGETITATTAGSSFTKQYTYQIPTAINGVPVDLANLTILAFIAEGRQEILTGIASFHSNVYYSVPAVKLNTAEQVILQSADDKILVKVVAQNISTAPVTSYNVKYTLNGQATDLAVTGKNISLLGNDTILLQITVPLNVKNTLTVSIDKVNDVANVSSSNVTLTVKKDLAFSNKRSLKLKLWQDRYGTETTWKLFDKDDHVIVSGGPYPELSSNTPVLREANLIVPENGVYRFELYDAYGDGINTGYGAGHYEIRTSTDSLLLTFDGVFTSKDVKFISVTENITGIRNVPVADITIYNAGDYLYISSPSSIASISIYDTLGKQVLLKNNVDVTLSLKDLNKGVYIVKAVTTSGEEKVVKIKK
jgi:hypothetical protein